MRLLTDEELTKITDSVCAEYGIDWGDWSALTQSDIEQFIIKVYDKTSEAQHTKDQKDYQELITEQRREFEEKITLAKKVIREDCNQRVKEIFEGIETSLDFAERVARVMDDLKSSQVWFIIGQAFEAADWEEAQDILTTVISQVPEFKAKYIRKEGGDG